MELVLVLLPDSGAAGMDFALGQVTRGHVIGNSAPAYHVRVNIDSAPDLLPTLEQLLTRVSKPIQYVGGEKNSIVKPWGSAQVRWTLMYPDAYEVGQPNQGLAILYEVLNEHDWILAERAFSVWPDLANLMRASDVPAFTLDGHRPLRAFDVVGMSLSTELCYTNVLNALDLAQIPVHQADRTMADPLVLIGVMPRSTPSPWPTSSTARFWAMARRPSSPSAKSSVTGRTRAALVAGTRSLPGWPLTPECTCRRSTTSSTCRTARFAALPPIAPRRRSW